MINLMGIKGCDQNLTNIASVDYFEIELHRASVFFYNLLFRPGCNHHLLIVLLLRESMSVNKIEACDINYKNNVTIITELIQHNA
jgi:hypothetical protein